MDFFAAARQRFPLPSVLLISSSRATTAYLSPLAEVDAHAVDVDEAVDPDLPGAAPQARAVRAAAQELGSRVLAQSREGSRLAPAVQAEAAEKQTEAGVQLHGADLSERLPLNCLAFGQVAWCGM